MAVAQVRDMDLGKLLKIVSKGSVYNTLNDESAMWEMMTRKLRKDAEQGAELRWNMRKSYGVAAAGFVPTSAGAYLNGHASQFSEATGTYKDFSLTIEVSQSLLKKAEKDIAAYGKPIAEEVEAKGIAMARVLSSTLTQDGTGIIGVVSSAVASTSLDTVTVTLKTGDTDRGYIGWFLEDDKVHVARLNVTEEKATINAAGSTPAYWLVTDVSRSTNVVTLKPYTSANAAINITAALSSTDLKASDLIRRSSSVWVDPAAIDTTTDYGQLSYQWPGLESLGADDNRLVHGINLTGALKGTQFDCGGDLIEPQDIQQALSKVKTRVGQNRYKYKAAFMAPETYDAMIGERETDRRFNTVQDNTRGTAELKYQHKKDSLSFDTDEFVRQNRIFCLPEGDALCFYGSDFDYVKPGKGGEWHLKPNSAGYDRSQQAMMEGCGLFFAQHSAAILTLRNFTLS